MHFYTKMQEAKYRSNLMKSLINQEKKNFWNPPKIKENFNEFSLEYTYLYRSYLGFLIVL